MDLENGSFEDWNQGTTFVDPVNGIETADSWFLEKGAAQPTQIILRSTNVPIEGSYIFQMTASSGLAGQPNSSTYIYQDVSNYTDYQGVPITIAGWFRSGSPLGQMHMFADDGVNVHVSPSTSVVSIGVWQQISFTFTVDLAATQLRVAFMPDTYNSFNADAITLSVNLEQVLNDDLGLSDNFFKVLNGAILQSLSDSLVVADQLIPPTGPITSNKATDDSVRMQDWLKISRHPAKWGN